jgi:NAD(P)-dependent dehydrogenase (short-subunit alcohol dehydrogenase family)
MTDLSGKSVLITGASRGIGAAAAYEFAERGARVALMARSEALIGAIASDIDGFAITGDVAHPQDIADAVEASVDMFGGLDILINNAGVLEPVERMEHATLEHWDRVIDVNVKGVMHGMRAALPVMKAQGGGSILTIGSGAATFPLEGWSAYCASKAAVHHLNACLHAEEHESGIRAIVLSPGTVATDMQKVIAASGVNPVSQIPWEDHIPVDWPAKTLAWMCGAEANGYLGTAISLREDDIRRAVGLIR